MFDLVSISKIVGFPDGNIKSLCPTMDLLVFSMNKMSLWVFRLNGERIYSINNRSIILHHTWSPDGKCFCLSGSDGKCRIYDTNNGNLLAEYDFPKPIQSIGWYQEPIHPDENELFEIDLMNNMPLLAKLFSSNCLDYMSVNSNEQVSFVFNNIFKLSFPTSYQVTHNDNHGFFNQFYMVNTENGTGLVNLTIQQDKALLKIIQLCSKIKLIFRELREELANMTKELPHFFTVLDRYLSNYYDNLKENTNESSVSDVNSVSQIVNSFNTILITNLIPQYLVDYWLNQFGERGLKRLLKLGNTAYDTIRNHCFKSCINYFEKLIILLNELHNLVEANKTSSLNDYGIDTKLVCELQELLKTHFKQFYKLIWDANDEQDLFNQFMNWVKYLLELLTKDKDDEDVSAVPNIKTIKLIEYFKFNLVDSKLWKYFSLDLSSNDIIKPSQDPEFDIKQRMEHLEAQFEVIFLQFERYFGSVIETSPIIHVSEEPISSFLVIGETGVACCVKESLIKLVSFNVFNPDKLHYASIEFNCKIINHQLFNENLILLVEKDSAFELQSYPLSKLFDGIQTPSHFSNVVMEAPDQLLLNPTKNFGCLLNKNKKDYCIFQI